MDRRENEPIANDLKVSDSSGSDRNPLRLPSERLLRRIETSGDLRKYVRLSDWIEAEPGPEGVGLRRGFAKGFEARLLQNRWLAPVVDDVSRFQ